MWRPARVLVSTESLDVPILFAPMSRSSSLCACAVPVPHNMFTMASASRRPPHHLPPSSAAASLPALQPQPSVGDHYVSLGHAMLTLDRQHTLPPLHTALPHPVLHSQVMLPDLISPIASRSASQAPTPKAGMAALMTSPAHSYLHDPMKATPKVSRTVFSFPEEGQLPSVFQSPKSVGSSSNSKPPRPLGGIPC